MKSLAKLSVFSILFAQAALAGDLTPEQYPFPFTNRWVSTITTAVDHADGAFKRVKYEPRPSRRKTGLFDTDNQIALGLFRHKGKAPLVFVISGIGGDGNSGTTLMLAEQFQKLGYHAVTVPNPFSSQYVIGYSATGLPGYMPSDATEYYRFLKGVANHLEKSEKLAISSYSVAGISLGGLLTGFLAREDEARHFFNFRKIVLINPAVDVRHAIDFLDSIHDLGKQIPEDEKTNIGTTLIDAAGPLLHTPITEDVLKAVASRISFPDLDLEWVIGETFRRSLRDVIFASQQVHDGGFLKTPKGDMNVVDRLNEAQAYSFNDYVNLFVFPTLRDKLHATREELLARMSLFALDKTLQTNPRVFVMENADDPLLRDGDLEALRALLGDRLYSYPYGGHVGNLWYGRNHQDLREIMSRADCGAELCAAAVN